MPDKVYVRRYSAGDTIVIDATDGTETLANATDVFAGVTDPNIANWGFDVRDTTAPTVPTAVAFFKQVKSGAFKPVFRSISADLDRLIFAECQIVKYCRVHAKRIKRARKVVFFLYTVKDKYYVAKVYSRRRYGNLWLRLYRLEDTCIWRARYRHRFVVPKLPKKQ